VGGILAAACGGTSSPSAPSVPGGGSTTPPPSGGSSPNGTMSANIDGVAWTAGGLTAKLANNKGSLNISAVNADSTISLGFDAASPTPETNPLAPGRVLQIPGTTSNARLQYFTNGFPGEAFVAAPFSGGSGSITINTLTSTSASGTFAFVMKSQSGSAMRTVTNGVFNVKY
jgi:hypothetical protein